MKYHENGTDTMEIIMKNTCEYEMLIGEFTITLPQTTWALVRKNPTYKEGNKFTHVSNCKKSGNNESCKVSLRKINGVMQGSAALTLPYWYGSLATNMMGRWANGTTDFNLVE